MRFRLNIASKAKRSQGLGTKEEIFFDSRARFDSDCEDDFFSVNGDFTPSQGSILNHQINTPMIPQLNTKSEPSPTERKMKLADLLRQNLQGEETNKQIAFANVEINGKPDVYKLYAEQPPRSSDGTPYLSGVNSISFREMTPTRNSKHKKEKTRRTKTCCLLSLLHSHGFSDSRKQKLNPEH